MIGTVYFYTDQKILLHIFIEYFSLNDLEH